MQALHRAQCRHFPSIQPFDKTSTSPSVPRTSGSRDSVELLRASLHTNTGKIIAVCSDMGKESTTLGKEGEAIAVQYLAEHGYQVIDRNYRSQQGEVDIIARDGDFIVFVEVKTYSIGSFGTPLGAVRKAKKESIIHAARTYLLKNNIKDINCRFDVLAIYRSWKGITSYDLIKDAFHVS